MEIVPPILAGLGLFFIGIRLIRDHLTQLAGPRMRRFMTRALDGQRSGVLFGLAAGAVMQSVTAVIFVLVALVSAGIVQAKRAFPVINWINLGASLIVVVASLNLRLLVLVLIGLVGVAYYMNLDQSARYRHVTGALLGIGLLFLGIDMIKSGSVPLKEAEWLRATLAESASSRHFFLSFVLGVAVTVLAQSSTTVTIVAMAMASAGVLRLDTGALVVIGAGLGAGLSALMLAGSASGSARQLLMYQFLLKLAGTLAMLALYLLEYVFGVPLLAAALRALDLGLSVAIAIVYVLFQVVSDVVMHFAGHSLLALIERVAPPTLEERLGQPHFLYDKALEEPQTALMLVDREQQELLSRLPEYLDPLREEAAGSGHDTTMMLRGDTSIARRCDQFLKDLTDRSHSREVLERAILLRDRNGLIVGVQETLSELVVQARSGDHPQVLGQLIGHLVEALHMMLETLAQASREHDEHDLALLKGMTQDRSDVMDDIRRGLLEADPDLDPNVRRVLFGATSLFERAVWLLRRHVLLLEQAQAQITADEALDQPSA